MSTKVVTNNHERELLAYVDLPDKYKESEGQYYIDENEGEEWAYEPRFFIYKGQVFDTEEFEIAPEVIRLQGWQGYMLTTYFMGYCVRYATDFYDTIVVGQWMAED